MIRSAPSRPPAARPARAGRARSSARPINAPGQRSATGGDVGPNLSGAASSQAAATSKPSARRHIRADGPSTSKPPRIRAAWARIPQPDGCLLFVTGKPVLLDGADEIGTAEAARIIGVKPRRMELICASGILREGIDWRRSGKRGFYKIKRAAAERYSGRTEEAST